MRSLPAVINSVLDLDMTIKTVDASQLDGISVVAEVEELMLGYPTIRSRGSAVEDRSHEFLIKGDVIRKGVAIFGLSSKLHIVSFTLVYETSPQWSSEGHVILNGVAIRFVQ
ncbi:hypothetical protein EMCRGX_G007643 [Ephydatia muelleri]